MANSSERQSLKDLLESLTKINDEILDYEYSECNSESSESDDSNSCLSEDDSDSASIPPIKVPKPHLRVKSFGRTGEFEVRNRRKWTFKFETTGAFKRSRIRSWNKLFAIPLVNTTLQANHKQRPGKFKLPDIQESEVNLDSAVNSRIYRISPLESSESRKCEVKFNFDNILETICCQFFFHMKCEKSCRLLHYFPRNFAEIFAEANLKQIRNAYETVKSNVLFKHTFVYFTRIFSHLNCKEDLINVIGDVLRQNYLAHFFCVKKIIYELEKCNCTFHEAIYLVTNKYFRGSNDVCLGNLLLDVVITRRNLTENLFLVDKLLIGRTEKLPIITGNDILNICVTELPNNYKLFKFVNEFIIGKGLIDFTFVPEYIIRSFCLGIK